MAAPASCSSVCNQSFWILYNGKDVRDPAREKLIQTRKTLVGQWMTAADILDKQGETTLAREVRTFTRQLPTVLTDLEKLTVDYVRCGFSPSFRSMRLTHTRLGSSPMRGDNLLKRY
jgi:hypothetical protein